MPLELYTIADENYAPGVVALVNSARKNGFTGPIHIGSPEPLSISYRPLDGVTFHVLKPTGIGRVIGRPSSC